MELKPALSKASIAAASENGKRSATNAPKRLASPLSLVSSTGLGMQTQPLYASREHLLEQVDDLRRRGRDVVTLARRTYD